MSYFFIFTVLSQIFSRVIQQMTNKTPRLILRKHTYYIRVALPRWAWRLTKKKEIRYSLATKDYYIALTKLRIESVKIDLYFNF